MPSRSESPFRRGRSRTLAAAPIAAVLAAGSLLGGCYGYGTYPRAEGQLWASSVNSAAAEEQIIESVNWVLERYPVALLGEADEIVLSLPAGMNPRRALRISDKLGPRVLPATPEVLDAGDRPVYHVGRIAQRVDHAEVDVYRPVFPEAVAEGTGGEVLYQTVTVTLEGGLRRWRVERTRPWAIGAFGPPPVNPVIVEETPGQGAPTPEPDRSSPADGVSDPEDAADEPPES